MRGQLNLTRKLGEKIRIGPAGEIVLTVLEIRGNRVRLGIEVPDRSITIHRAEENRNGPTQPSRQ